MSAGHSSVRKGICCLPPFNRLAGLLSGFVGCFWDGALHDCCFAQVWRKRREGTMMHAGIWGTCTLMFSNCRYISVEILNFAV